jgi:hypothetical protein
MFKARYLWAVALVATSACAAPGTAGMPPGATSPSSTSSQMETNARPHDLLYVSEFGGNKVSVYSYPQGIREGTLTGVASPAGVCVDKMGDVFVTEFKSAKIREYAHAGTSPISTLHDANASPVACSVDPTTGNLAVANQVSKDGLAGVSIYTGARGMPTNYTVNGMYQYYSVAYDDAGNLFVDGINTHKALKLAQMPKGGTKFEKLTVNQHIRVPGNVQWDGTYLALGDRANGTIYRFAIAGNGGTEIGSAHLVGANDTCQFWIQGARVVAPSFSDGVVMFWDYPGGGSPTKTIAGFDQPFGVAVSHLAE